MDPGAALTPPEGVRIEDLDEIHSRAAGEACSGSKTSDVVDASVVVGAVARHDLIVTSDPDDMIRLASALDRRLEVFGV